MPFHNEKRTFLAKLDKSKKGSLDEKAILLLQTINSKENYYTTSSCSGRVYLWTGSGKKNETNWLRVSHDAITREFFNPVGTADLVWLRLEAPIFHLACKDINAANKLLETVRPFYKKGCILSASNKIVIEIRGSEFIEMPLYYNNQLLFQGDLSWLTNLINEKLEKMWKNMKEFCEVLKNFG